MYRKPITISLEVKNRLVLAFLLLAMGPFSSEGLAQESTHVTVSPIIGLPGDEVSLPIYLETAPEVEVGSIALEIIFPHDLMLVGMTLQFGVAQPHVIPAQRSRMWKPRSRMWKPRSRM